MVFHTGRRARQDEDQYVTYDDLGDSDLCTNERLTKQKERRNATEGPTTLWYAPPSGHATIKESNNWPTHRRKTDLLPHQHTSETLNSACPCATQGSDRINRCAKL